MSEARERAEELAAEFYAENRTGAIWDGLTTRVEYAKKGYVAGYLARDAEPPVLSREQFRKLRSKLEFGQNIVMALKNTGIRVEGDIP